MREILFVGSAIFAVAFIIIFDILGGNKKK